MTFASEGHAARDWGFYEGRPRALTGIPQSRASARPATVRHNPRLAAMRCFPHRRQMSAREGFPAAQNRHIMTRGSPQAARTVGQSGLLQRVSRLRLLLGSGKELLKPGNDLPEGPCARTGRVER